MPDFPNDDNGQALGEMLANGDNLEKARTMNFSVIFDGVEGATAFQKAMSARGHHSKLEDDADGTFDVTVSVFMLPTHKAISEFERMLADNAAEFGGRNDGWGAFAQK